MRTRSPIHPGEILNEEFLVPYRMSANKLARSVGVPANRISGIIKGTRNITGDTAHRLAKAFGTSPEFWMNLQSQYDLEMTLSEKGAELKKVRRIKFEKGTVEARIAAAG